MHEEDQIISPSSKNVSENRAEKTSFWVLLLGLFLSPVFFIPSAIVPLQSAKAYLVFLVVIVAAAAWIVARLKDGKLIIPRSWIYLFFLAIPFWFLITALFSPNQSLSLVGEAYEVGTFAFITAIFVLGYLVSVLFRNTRQSAYAYLAFFASFIVVALFQFIHLFAPQALSFGVFTSAAASMLGNWNDLGIYFGSVALFAFITLELLALEAKYKYLFTVIMVVALFLLTIVNFSVVWYVLAASAVIFFVYNFSFKKVPYDSRGGMEELSHGRRLPWASLVIFIVSIIFILVQGNVYTTLANVPSLNFLGHLSVPSTEVRPSLQGTVTVAAATLHTSPILGTGPNRFSSAWLLARPVSVNATPFWSVIFSYGVGLIPTFFITTGPIGFLLWIGFFAVFLWLGFRSLFARKENVFAEYVTVSSFIIALYFWIFTVMDVPSAALLVLTLFFTGIFLGSITGTPLVRMWEFNFTKSPKVSFISVLVFVVLLLTGLVSIYNITRRFVSTVYFNAAIADASVNGDIVAAHDNLIRAIQFNADPLYYRSLAQLDLTNMQQILSTTTQAQSALANQFQAYLTEAQAAAIAARTADPTDYQNWLVLGQIAGSVASFDTSTSTYETARSYYEQAHQLDPTDPSVFLSLAQLDVAHGAIATATADINQALILKNDYTNAIFLLAQIQASQGNITSAIKSLQAAIASSPQNAGLRFNLGLLYYDTKNWSNAAAMFQQAIILLPQYANAEYFLGLSEANLGNTTAALTEFENLAVSNPNDPTISAIIANLKAGHSPLTGLTPPASTPQKASQPPVKDATTGSTVSSPTVAPTKH